MRDPGRPSSGACADRGACHDHRYGHRRCAHDRGPCAVPWRRYIGIVASPSKPRPMRRRSFAASGRTSRKCSGNLVDNACKWATSRVFIEVRMERPAGAGAAPILRVTVDDDGARAFGGRARPGLPSWPAARRIQAGFGARAIDRGRPRRPVWRQFCARQRADRRITRRIGAARWRCRAFERCFVAFFALGAGSDSTVTETALGPGKGGFRAPS